MNGQLGTGDAADTTSPVSARLTGAVEVATGGSAQHTCAIRTDLTVACWGANGSGQLGDGTTTTRYVP